MTATTDILQDFRSTLRDLDACAVDILDSSPLARALYSSDASIYRVVPTAIARPRHIDELSALVTAASQVGLPITAITPAGRARWDMAAPGTILWISISSPPTVM